MKKTQILAAAACAAGVLALSAPAASASVGPGQCIGSWYRPTPSGTIVALPTVGSVWVDPSSNHVGILANGNWVEPGVSGVAYSIRVTNNTYFDAVVTPFGGCVSVEGQAITY